MSGNCELGRGLLRREKNATEGGAGRFEKPAPDARAAPPEAHESLIGRKTVEEVPLTGLSSSEAVPLFERALAICSAVLGPSHPRTVAVRKHLASIRQERAAAKPIQSPR
jgi:hypothetical protein